MNWEQRYNDLLLRLKDVASDMGVYPQAVQGFNDQRDYKERDGYKNGWNAAVIEYGGAVGRVIDQANEEVDEDLRVLLAADVGFLREDGSFDLNMNDTWAWASADQEHVTKEEIPEVARLYQAYGHCGLVYWVSEKNNQMTSEFKDINRRIEFVRQEEAWRKKCRSSSAAAYGDLTYTLGAPRG